MDASLEASTMRKVYLRLLPFAIVCYVLAYIDRINSSFAALTMRGDLNMSAADFGFKGWQIMFIAEGLPTIALGILCYFVMTNKPEQATFLTQPEKDWLASKIAGERQAKEAIRTYSMLESMFNPKVLLLALNYLG